MQYLSIVGQSSVFNGMSGDLYPSGERMSEGTIKNGKRNGLWKIYNKSGSEIAKYRYRGGKLIDENRRLIKGSMNHDETGGFDNHDSIHADL